MAWIELHQAVWTHRKTLLLAAELDLTETYAAGHVIRLWCWALDNTPEGDLTGLPEKVIAFGADWRGDPTMFVAALIRAGWVDSEEDGELRLHDWSEYAGRLIDRRKQDADRKRTWREKQDPSIKDVQRTGRGRGADVQSTSGVPYRTQPDRTQPDPTGPGERGAAAPAARAPAREKSEKKSDVRELAPIVVITDEWIDEQVALFGPQLGGEWRARDAINLALNHKNRKKYDDVRVWVLHWLQGDVDSYQEERANEATRSGHAQSGAKRNAGANAGERGTSRMDALRRANGTGALPVPAAD